MSWWRKMLEWVVTVALVLILAFAVLGFILAQDQTTFDLFPIAMVLVFGPFIKLGAVAFLRRRDRLYAADALDARATVRLGRPVADGTTVLVCFWLVTVGWLLFLISKYSDGDSVDRFVMVAGLVLFSGVSIASTWSHLRKGPLTLELSPRGLRSNRFGDLTIGWPDIHSVKLIGLGRFGALKVIILKLADEAKYLPRKKKPFWAWGDGMTLGTSFAIPLNLDVSSRLVLQAIQARLSAFGSAADASSAMKETR